MKRPSIKSITSKADKLLTPIIKKLYPKCLLCGRPTEVAHHFCHRSKSNRLRYEILNLINLCSSCHFALHQNESIYSARIVAIKGLKWWKQIEKMKQETIHKDSYFRSKYEELKQIYENT